jgi:hypothetical protein
MVSQKDVRLHTSAMSCPIFCVSIMTSTKQNRLVLRDSKDNGKETPTKEKGKGSFLASRRLLAFGPHLGVEADPLPRVQRRVVIQRNARRQLRAVESARHVDHLDKRNIRMRKTGVVSFKDKHFVVIRPDPVLAN